MICVRLSWTFVAPNNTQTTCAAKAVASGVGHAVFDAIGFIPEEGALADLVYGGAQTIKTGKLQLGFIGTGAGLSDTSPTGKIGTALGVGGLLAAKATPLVGQIIAGLSIANDVVAAGIEVYNCNQEHK